MTSLVWSAARVWQSAHSSNFSTVWPSFLPCFCFTLISLPYWWYIGVSFCFCCIVKHYNNGRFASLAIRRWKRIHSQSLYWFIQTQVQCCLLIYWEHSFGISVLCLSSLLSHTNTVLPVMETSSPCAVANQRFDSFLGGISLIRHTVQNSKWNKYIIIAI